MGSEPLLQNLIGHTVQIHSDREGSEVSDTGILEGFDAHWVCLNKNGEMLYFSLYRIRLIKPL